MNDYEFKQWIQVFKWYEYIKKKTEIFTDDSYFVRVNTSKTIAKYSKDGKIIRGYCIVNFRVVVDFESDWRVTFQSPIQKKSGHHRY